MTALLIVLLIVVLLGVAWWSAPEITKRRDAAHRWREIELIKLRTLEQFQFEREQALRRREQYSRDRLERIVHDLDS